MTPPVLLALGPQIDFPTPLAPLSAGTRSPLVALVVLGQRLQPEQPFVPS